MSDILLGELGKDILIFIQSLSPLLDIPFLIITLLGDVIFYITVIGSIYWSFSKKLGIILFSFMTISGISNTFLKGIFGVDRPYLTYPSEIKEISSVSGYSFPSGHAMSSSAFFGFFSLRNKDNIKIILFSGIIIILVSLSRIYLGVHYLSDVLVGIVLGLTFSIIVLKTLPWFETFFSKQNDFSIITFVLLVSFILMLLSTITTELFGNIIEAAPNGNLPGILAGGVIGFVLERKKIGFKTENIDNWTKFVRIFLGFSLILATYILGKAFTSTVTGNLIVMTDYMVFFVVGLVATLVVPYVFSKYENIAKIEAS